ncbi:MAG: hypothetical protein A2W05_10595 [Candidatus Schekmanbacteria bacterium RBG_16_38_10]|uniref:Uncharacterized protein n=1 Tax=Candidatus Schekmanbacteria bacterium RBG_16_38_10 TaxID=1817879 RepID=A0A1F7RUW9_9BACT|nr:MAG: hypothetical protein A2W05_10595 [Candidatus Schekmanbacteria bacterium RBG_16_38_10]
MFFSFKNQNLENELFPIKAMGYQLPEQFRNRSVIPHLMRNPVGALNLTPLPSGFLLSPAYCRQE